MQCPTQVPLNGCSFSGKVGHPGQPTTLALDITGPKATLPCALHVPWSASEPSPHTNQGDPVFSWGPIHTGISRCPALPNPPPQNYKNICNALVQRNCFNKQVPIHSISGRWGRTSQSDPRKPFLSHSGQAGEGWSGSHCPMPTARVIRIFRGIMTESENTAAPESPSFFLLSLNMLQVSQQSTGWHR